MKDLRTFFNAAKNIAALSYTAAQTGQKNKGNKKPPSFTKTQTKDEDEPTRDGGAHSNSSVDYFVIRHPNPHKTRHDEGKFECFNAYSALCATSTTGQIGLSPLNDSQMNAVTQNQTLIPPLFTLQSILDIRQYNSGAATFTANTMLQSKNAVATSATLFELDQNTNATGSTNFPLFTGAEVNNQGFQRKVHLKRIKDHVTFTNFSNVGCRVKVTWYMCKNNCAKTPVELMDDGLLTHRPTGTFPIHNRQTPGVINGPGFGFPGFVGSIGSNLNDTGNFPLMRKYWKPLKIKHFVLQPGDNHELVYTVIFRRYISKEDLVLAYTPSGDLATGDIENLYYKGLTIIPVVTIVPHNVVDSGEGSEVMSKVTTGPYSVGTTTFRNYEFGFVNHKVNLELQYIQNAVQAKAVGPTTKLIDVEDKSVDVLVTTV